MFCPGSTVLLNRCVNIEEVQIIVPHVGHLLSKKHRNYSLNFCNLCDLLKLIFVVPLLLQRFQEFHLHDAQFVACLFAVLGFE